jgi:hypothetical protein
MYKVVAEKGNVNVDLDLTDLINECNSIVNDKETHNRKVLDNLDNLANSYIGKLNRVLESNYISPSFEIRGHLKTSHKAYYVIGLGHGLGNINITIKVEVNSDGLYGNPIEGEFSVYKNWQKGDANKEVFKLESVGQILEKGLDVIKINHLYETLSYDTYDIAKQKFQY